MIVKIRAKDYNLWLDGKAVERFIKKAANISEIEGSSGRDISRQIEFWTKDEEIGYNIEGMPGYETAYWDTLKVDMKRRWEKFYLKENIDYLPAPNYSQKLYKKVG
ncbi:hypothetical protein O181_071379 [Austropuccinia psidii MF-1]|uniref:Uncharacterized protein n=1 Tax=Austropuccinia psidii MF-1 TaxID=1389203 RepID=A0A9Q3F332_9BASI|nr:hypothetical protein [Austropuccinia psidii MF-1]